MLFVLKSLKQMGLCESRCKPAGTSEWHCYIYFISVPERPYVSQTSQHTRPTNFPCGSGPQGKWSLLQLRYQEHVNRTEIKHALTTNKQIKILASFEWIAHIIIVSCGWYIYYWQVLHTNPTFKKYRNVPFHLDFFFHCNYQEKPVNHVTQMLPGDLIYFRLLCCVLLKKKGRSSGFFLMNKCCSCARAV